MQHKNVKKLFLTCCPCGHKVGTGGCAPSREGVAALIPLEDLALLEELEDRFDIEEVERRLADPNEAPIPYEQVRKELGLAWSKC